MEIHGPGRTPEIGKIVPEKQINPSKQAKTAQQTSKEDTVLISERSKLLNKIASLPPVRQEKVDQIKAQVESGIYLTDDKLSATIDRILQELGE